MSAFIYFEDSAHIINSYKTMAAAKAALTRARNKGKGKFNRRIYGEKDLNRMAVCTSDYFNRKVDYDVIVKSLMGGQDVTIRRSEQGGCTDPSTERYWSM